jgi:hypothetical protein
VGQLQAIPAEELAVLDGLRCVSDHAVSHPAFVAAEASLAASVAAVIRMIATALTAAT